MQVWNSAWAFHQASRLNFFQFNLIHLCQCPLPEHRGLMTWKWQAPSLRAPLSYSLFGECHHLKPKMFTIYITERPKMKSHISSRWPFPALHWPPKSSTQSITQMCIYIFPTCIYRDSKRFLFSDLWTSNIFSCMWKFVLRDFTTWRKSGCQRQTLSTFDCLGLLWEAPPLNHGMHWLLGS